MTRIVKILLLYMSFGIFGIGALLLRYCVLIFPEYFIKNREKKLKICLRILKKSWQIFTAFLKSVRIIQINNAEEIKNIKNSIIVSTHPSYIDVLVLMSIIPNTTCFVAEKILRNPFFKGMADLLFISDSKNIDEWEKTAVDILNSGFNVLIFPMGERHKKNEKPKIRKGAALLAQKSKKNTAMIQIDTSYDFLSKNTPIHKIKSEPVIYNLSFLGEIKTEELLNKYSDDITFKREFTKIITDNLYK